uniref:polynucleotide adenylyltransferase n=1 Tax=Anthurium amnicola TaxID=1678845 RepID=A0A1D1Y3S8_9ARAE
MLISRFFRVYTQWRWPNPVMLCSIEEDEPGFPVWDPRVNFRDRTHHMPIITPAYPCMNSSYNVSVSTLRVMMEQFEFGNKVCEEIELNKAGWGALFEPYLFFESYKNYLQVDIVAEDVDDLRTWKGWVESRLRQLTLKIERDTFGMLQCHPYPHEYVDTSKQCSHTAFFMGLQRKQGVKIQEGQQFDIRGTVDEFRHAVNMFMFWKPGMEIYVSHVRKKQIPSFVFPEGYKRPRPSRLASQQQVEKASTEDGAECGNGSTEKLPKRRDDDEFDAQPSKRVKCVSVSPIRQKSLSPESGGSLPRVILTHTKVDDETKTENVVANVGKCKSTQVESTQEMKDDAEDERTCSTGDRHCGGIMDVQKCSVLNHSSSIGKCPVSCQRESMTRPIGTVASEGGQLGRQPNRKLNSGREDLKPNKQEKCAFGTMLTGTVEADSLASGNLRVAHDSPTTCVGICRNSEGCVILEPVMETAALYGCSNLDSFVEDNIMLKQPMGYGSDKGIEGKPVTGTLHPDLQEAASQGTRLESPSQFLNHSGVFQNGLTQVLEVYLVLYMNFIFTSF